MEVLIGVVSLIVTVVGVYITYLQLRRAPEPPEEGTESRAKENITDIERAVAEPLKDNPSLEELLLLVDWITSEAVALRHVATTFGEKRRILALLIKLMEKASAYWGLVSNGIEDNVAKQMSFFIEESLPTLLSEVSAVLPLSDEEHITLETDTWKELTYNLHVDWEVLKNTLLRDTDLRTRFLRLRADETRLWPLLGFESAKDYEEYISPTFSTLCRNLSPLQRELLSTLVATGVVSVDDLVSDGFPKEVIVETFNSLMRSKLLYETGHYRVFKLSSIGKKIVADFLNQGD